MVKHESKQVASYPRILISALYVANQCSIKTPVLFEEAKNLYIKNPIGIYIIAVVFVLLFGQMTKMPGKLWVMLKHKTLLFKGKSSSMKLQIQKTVKYNRNSSTNLKQKCKEQLFSFVFICPNLILKFLCLIANINHEIRNYIVINFHTFDLFTLTDKGLTLSSWYRELISL